MPTTNTESWKRVASFRSRSGRRAFTLLELLIVVAIIAILGAVLINGIGTLGGSAITNGANLVLEDFSFAQQLAISSNRPAEIWLLRQHGGTSITALQVFTIDDTGRMIPYGELHRLPTGAVIDSGQVLSPLLSTATSPPYRQWPNPLLKPTISTFGTNYDSWYVRFMPDASTTLNPNQQWYLTVHSQNLGDQLAALPKNYAVISVEPVTGHVGIYRPGQ